jgi:formate/nitrite transporter
MDYVKPEQVINQMVEIGTAKANLSGMNMLVRGILGGAILACATTLAFTAVVQTKIGMAGALIFPVGFVMIVLLGLELVTGSFAFIPLSVLKKKTTMTKMLKNYFWVIAGHLIGSILYAGMYDLIVTKMGNDMASPLAQLLIQTAEAKTIAYQIMGVDGMILVIIKAILCNWMVTCGAVMALTSTSTLGKIVAMWLPILTFFGQGFEHAVVNMFVIPAGMMLGADVSFGDWWIWNQIPVLVGNFIGGALFTGFSLYLSQKGNKISTGGLSSLEIDYSRMDAAAADKSA